MLKDGHTLPPIKGRPAASEFCAQAIKIKWFSTGASFRLVKLKPSECRKTGRRKIALEKLKKYLEENKLQGTQLFAPDKEIPFLKEYDIKGIPHFILLDKEGKIIEADAARPSDPQLKKLIESLL